MRRPGTVLAAVALSLAAGLTARMGGAEEPRAALAGREDIVRLEVDISGNKVVLTSRFGEMARVDGQDGSALGLVPVAASDGGVTFRVFDLTRSHEGQNGSRALDEVQARPGVAAFSKLRTDLSLTLLPTQRLSAEKADLAAPMRGFPLTDTLIRWNMMQDGREIHLAVREGEIARLRIEGQWYGLAPMVKDRALGDVSFRIFALPKSSAGSGPRLLEAFELTVGAEHFPHSLAGVQIRLAGFEEVSREGLKSAAAATQDDSGAGEVADGCCVRCGGTTACGCAVEMDCGECCSPPCCYKAE